MYSAKSLLLWFFWSQRRIPCWRNSEYLMQAADGSRNGCQRFGNVLDFNLITENLPLKVDCYTCFTTQWKWHFRLFCFNICSQLFMLKWFKNQLPVFLKQTNNYHFLKQAIMLGSFFSNVTPAPIMLCSCPLYCCCTL